MQEHERDNTLTNQAISKLLDFGSVPIPKGSGIQQLLEPSISELLNYTDTSVGTAGETSLQTTWQQKKNGTLEKQAPTTGGKVFVVIAWIILVLIVGAVVGNLGFKLEFPPSLETVQRSSGYLFHITMLALAGCVLSLTTWLYWKNRLGKVANIAVVIVIILSGTLPLLTMGGSGGTTGMKRISRALLRSSSHTTIPMGERITGILYSEDKPAAIIGYRIVHERDTIHGVMVVKIHKDKVEFEKDGKGWIQTIQGAPTAYWE